MGDKGKKRKRPTQDQHPGGSKSPRSAIPGLGDKRPIAGADVDKIYDQHPAWRISKLERGGPFGWRGVSAEKLLEICGKLAELEAVTWREILMTRKKQNHHIAIEDLGPEARRALRRAFPDVDEVLSLHLTGKNRVLGVLQGSVMLIVWWDEGHQFCPTDKD